MTRRALVPGAPSLPSRLEHSGVPGLRWRLFPKYATLIVALVGGMLAASGAISVWFSWREILMHLEALQQEKAQGAAARIEQYVLDFQHALSWTAFPRMNSGGDAVQQRRIEYLKLLRQAPAITELLWIGEDGRERLRVSRLAMDSLTSGTDLSQDPAFMAARSGKPYFGPVQFRKGTEPYMAIARAAGGDGGVTVADVNLKFVWDVVSRIKVGKSGWAYAVDASGTLIAHPDISLVLKKTDMRVLPQVASALQGTSHDGVGDLAMDLSGATVLAARAPIRSLGWEVFVETPRRETFEPLYAMLWRMGLMLAAGLALAALASFFLARALVRPIGRLQDGAARIGSGDLDHRIGLRSGDELQSLSEQFDHMAVALKASYAELERKVEARTAELREALDRQTASAEVLRVISSSPNDTRPVFEAIVQACQRLFAGRVVAMSVPTAGKIEPVAFAVDADAAGAPNVGLLVPQPLDKESPAGAALLELRTVHVVDPEPGAGEFPRLRDQALASGCRSGLFVPLVRGGEAHAVLSILRGAPGAFSTKEVALATTFANQALIAIDNARLFRELRDKSAQLEAANRHKSEFLANMSHELRTPLNAIIGFSEVLTEQMFGEVNAKQLEYLQDIHSSGQHLLSLINDVLDLSKIEAGRMELELSCFDLGLLLEHSAALVRERAQRQGLGVTIDVAEGLDEWVADARKVKQVVVNLLSNAVKFTPNGGQIVVRARCLGPADGRAGTCAEVSVSDTGVGIAAEDQALVFEEFRQVGRDVLRKAEGTGLGLALVRRFVELHGGQVHLDSEPGKGSTFTLTLPQLELPGVQ